MQTIGQDRSFTGSRPSTTSPQSSEHCSEAPGVIRLSVADEPAYNTPGLLRAIYKWITGAPQLPGPAPLSTADDRDRAALPVRIGHYAVARKLGEGGMGIVYAARDPRLDRIVALKTMSSLADDETARKRFWREARAAASVNHPNICQIYDVGEDGGQLFIAMELLEG